MSELLSQWTASDGLNARKSISRKGSECLWLPTLHHPFHGILRSFRIRQLVGEVGAGGRGGTGAVGVVFSVVEVVVGLFLVLPAGGVDMYTQFTVQEHCLCPFSPGTSQIDGIGRAVAL